MGTKFLKKEDMGAPAGAGAPGIQALVAQLKEQAGNGEVDENLIDQLVEATNVAVDQKGQPNNEVSADAALAGQELGASPAVEAAPPPPPMPSIDEEEAQKIHSARSGVPSVILPVDSDSLQSKLPEFIKAMEAGSIKKAQAVSGGNQPDFDRMFNMACRAVLTEGGFTYQNVRKLHNGAPGELDLQKAISAADLSGVYLMRLAKLMMPVYAGLRRRFPSDVPQTGADNAQWKTQIGFQNLNKANLLITQEAAIGDEINESFLTFSTPYRDIAVNDRVTLKATAAARGYDDPLQVSVIRAMTAILEGEERKILGDNHAAIAAPGKPTVVTSGSGTLGGATDKFSVTALTYRGWLAGSVGTTSAIGETDEGTLSDAVNLSAVATATITWAAVPGAVAYNVFHRPSGSNPVYLKTVTINKAVVTSVTGSGAPSATNKSANAYGMEGLLSWCELSTIYGNAIPNKTTIVDNAGATLTTGASGITQFDSILARLWKNWQIAPSLMVCSPDMVGAITDKILALNSGAMYRIEVSQERGTMAGGAFVSGYVNKYAPYADGTPRYIDIIPHPYMPDGTIQFLSETIPYPMSRESRGFALDTLIPYTYFPLAASTIVYPYALTVSEVLECFHPAAQTALVGVATS
jgi:hypothetical protein